MIDIIITIVLGIVIIVMGIQQAKDKIKASEIIEQLENDIIDRDEDIEDRVNKYHTIYAESTKLKKEYDKCKKEYVKLETRFIEEVEQREENNRLLSTMIEDKIKLEDKLKETKKELRAVVKKTKVARSYTKKRIPELEQKVADLTGNKRVLSWRKLKD